MQQLLTGKVRLSESDGFFTDEQRAIDTLIRKIRYPDYQEVAAFGASLLPRSRDSEIAPTKKSRFG